MNTQHKIQFATDGNSGKFSVGIGQGEKMLTLYDHVALCIDLATVVPVHVFRLH